MRSRQPAAAPLAPADLALAAETAARIWGRRPDGSRIHRKRLRMADVRRVLAQEVR